MSPPHTYATKIFFFGRDLDLHMVVFVFQGTGAENILANTEKSTTDEAKQGRAK